MKGVALSADLAEAGTLSSKMAERPLRPLLRAQSDFPEVYEKEKPQQITPYRRH